MSAEAAAGKEEEAPSKVAADVDDAAKMTTAGLVDPASNKNAKKVVCARCDSVILLVGAAAYERKSAPGVEMPLVRQSKRELVEASAAKFESEPLADFWLVHDMYAFENVGFTNTVDQKKYLICADCEIGPIGYQNLEAANEYLVALSRVKHV